MLAWGTGGDAGNWRHRKMAPLPCWNHWNISHWPRTIVPLKWISLRQYIPYIRIVTVICWEFFTDIEFCISTNVMLNHYRLLMYCRPVWGRNRELNSPHWFTHHPTPHHSPRFFILLNLLKCRRFFDVTTLSLLFHPLYGLFQRYPAILHISMRLPMKSGR